MNVLALRFVQMLENQVEVRQREVDELQSQAHVLRQEGKDTDEVDGRRKVVEQKFQELLEPLNKRKNFLMASREIHQFNRDVEDEIVSFRVSCFVENFSCKRLNLIFVSLLTALGRGEDAAGYVYRPW